MAQAPAAGSALGEGDWPHLRDAGSRKLDLSEVVPSMAQETASGQAERGPSQHDLSEVGPSMAQATAGGQPPGLSGAPLSRGKGARVDNPGEATPGRPAHTPTWSAW